MIFDRRSNHHWLSVCGLYRVAAFGTGDQFLFSATYMRPNGEYDQLGLFSQGSSKQNAADARQACIEHQQAQQGRSHANRR